jgi:hypothetical protein
MSGGGGGSGNGGGDMQVSGAEAAYSQEKGISTAADTRISQTSFSPGGGGEGQIDHVDSSGNLVTSNIGTGPGEVDPGLAAGVLGPDTSMVGKSVPTYSDTEIEKGYTDEGVKLDQVGAGKYMTKEQQYNMGLIEKDFETGQDVQGRYRVNENTGELERTDMSFADHWKNAPEALKYSPTLRLLYAGGKNVGEWMGKKGFEGYNEAGARRSKWGWIGGDGTADPMGKAATGGRGRVGELNQERAMMTAIAPAAPYIVSGTTQPTNSPAANWFQNLGSSSVSGASGGFNLATEYAAAKSKVAQTLGTPSAIGQLAVNQSPFYNWLKDNSLDKGIL